MAGIDGVQNKIDPGAPLEKDIYGLSAEELKNVPSTPGSLEEAVLKLGSHHNFLVKGDVFTKDVIDTWVDWKINHEIRPMQMRPVPYEFYLYFDM